MLTYRCNKRAIYITVYATFNTNDITYTNKFENCIFWKFSFQIL